MEKNLRLKQWVWYALIIIPELVLIMQLIIIGNRLNTIIDNQPDFVGILDMRNYR